MDILLPKLASLGIYKTILEDVAVSRVVTLLELLHDETTDVVTKIKTYSEIYSFILENNCRCLYEYVENLTFQDENAFTLLCEKQEIKVDNPLIKQAAAELDILQNLSTINCMQIKKRMSQGQSSEISQIIDNLPNWNCYEEKEAMQWGKKIEERTKWHRDNGAGLFAKHAFFSYDGECRTLQPVTNPDPIMLDKLYLVDSQKDMAIKNTKIFLSGRAANNILFYGDRGTGKSSMVKAIANECYHQGLRLVEVPKKYLEQMPVIISLLSDRGLKFVLFIDDLAFENNEEEYTALKAVLEGGIEHRPRNILIYATSNRRHIIKETFSDRKGLISDNPDDEVRARDAMQEKLSLSDRFGITIVFSSPIKKEYLQIVHKMAQEEGIDIEPALLEQKAMQWEMAYNGMSPRTARQFINWLKGELSINNNLF
jgi:predicted AAA+ superfamily ATPase